jgi:hypothetical protein
MLNKLTNMITYKWSIEKVVVTTNDAVTHVYWRCDGTDNVNSAACAGIKELVLGDSFTPYDQLTEQQVLDWCFTIKDDAEGQVAGQIANQILKKQAEPALPWTKEQL